MIERLTDAAVTSIALAEDQAREIGQPVDSALILLGIFSTICDAGWILTELGVDIADASEKLKGKICIVGEPSGRSGYSAAAREIFDMSCSFADKRGAAKVSTADLLIAIIQCGKGAGFDVLGELGLTAEVLSNSLDNRILSEKQTEYLHPDQKTICRKMLFDMIEETEKLVKRHEAAADEARRKLKTMRSWLRLCSAPLDEQ